MAVGRWSANLVTGNTSDNSRRIGLGWRKTGGGGVPADDGRAVVRRHRAVPLLEQVHHPLEDLLPNMDQTLALYYVHALLTRAHSVYMLVHALVYTVWLHPCIVCFACWYMLCAASSIKHLRRAGKRVQGAAWPAYLHDKCGPLSLISSGVATPPPTFLGGLSPKSYTPNF